MYIFFVKEIHPWQKISVMLLFLILKKCIDCTILFCISAPPCKVAFDVRCSYYCIDLPFAVQYMLMCSYGNRIVLLLIVCPFVAAIPGF